MRKDVTLGMSIGGVLLAVVIVILSVSSHNKTNHHPVEVGPVADSGAGDTAPVVTPDTSTTETAPKPEVATSEPTAPPAAPSREEQKPAVVKNDADATPATKPAPDGTATANAAGPSSDKQDPVWGGKLWSNTQTPLIGVSTAGDPNEKTAEQLNAQLNNSAITSNLSKPNEVATKAPAVLPDGIPPAPDRTAASRPAEAARTHTVEKGETFSTIAATAYGSANYYPYLMRANPKIDPKSLRPGMTINIPDISAVKPAEKQTTLVSDLQPKSKPADSTPADPNQYKVQPGDNLTKIAIKKFGKIDMVSRIYELNKETIGDDPAKLKVGTILKLPPAPVASAAH